MSWRRGMSGARRMPGGAGIALAPAARMRRPVRVARMTRPLRTAAAVDCSSEPARAHQKPPAPLMDLAEQYDPAKTDETLYRWWEDSRHFRPRAASDGAPVFSMILPPPNVTGSLHLGHALQVTIQDSMARWARMRGQSVHWIPGVDHAGIATQVVVEKELWRDCKLTPRDIGREEFEQRVGSAALGVSSPWSFSILVAVLTANTCPPMYLSDLGLVSPLWRSHRGTDSTARGIFALGTAIFYLGRVEVQGCY